MLKSKPPFQVIFEKGAYLKIDLSILIIFIVSQNDVAKVLELFLSLRNKALVVS